MESFADPKKNIEYLHLKSDSVVADLGTGSGHYAFALGEKIKAMGGGGHGIVYAIEVQKSLLDRVKQEADRRGLGNVSVIWGDVDVLGGTKLADNICDALVVSNVLFQSESREAFLKEANRILKPGGEVLVIDWGIHISREEVEKIVQNVGFSKVKEFDAGAHHWGLLLRKK